MNVGTWLVGLAAPMIKRALVSLGFGIVSFAAVSAALNAALDAAKAAWSGLGGEALALLQMAGVNTAASILAGALVARVSLMLLKKIDLVK